MVAVTGSGLWIGLPTAVHADPTQPSASDRQIALAVSMLVERQHLSGHKLDTEMSDRCFETFIKDLDPLKLFFYQSDIDEFKARENELAVSLKRGDIQFAYDVFGRFLEASRRARRHGACRLGSEVRLQGG